METKPLIEWPHVSTEFIMFIGTFLALGAVGFYLGVMRRLTSIVTAGPAGERAVHIGSTRRAAFIGLLGILIGVVMFAVGLPASAARHQQSVMQLITTDSRTILNLAFYGLALIGFLIALAPAGRGWMPAAIGVIGGRLSGLLLGQWGSLVISLHVLAAGIWIGSLLVLVIAGIGVVFRVERSTERRGAIVADMVHRFSPMALLSGGAVVLFGVITALQHLNPFSSLWSTPYGYALLAKLAAVAFVFGLGGWNWLRLRPQLGTEAGAATIRRSAARELIAATVVLALTAILVSLPSPRG
ncbi:MAG TPA: CopD family protein [Candidatus Kapabacteria bacterium]|nr:CopD family protein [Candidatus Kapabacteria bacterium]